MQYHNHFTMNHLLTLRNEIDLAGSFHQLMLQKKAISKNFGMQFIRLYNNIEKYKRKFLIGSYESLQSIYDTEMPYLFWNEMYCELLREEAKHTLL
jgi:hypothetical protein